MCLQYRIVSGLVRKYSATSVVVIRSGTVSPFLVVSNYVSQYTMRSSRLQLALAVACRSMTTDDERIGQNVATLRGDRSQKSIAEAMQEAGGHKWSQATVWSVEKGQRPLRLTEAIDLARILGRPVAALFADPEQTKGDEFAEGIIQAVAKYYGDIVTKAMSLYEARERFDALKASLEEG